LLSFAFPLNDFYSAFRAGEAPALPSAEPTWLALYRRDYIVRRMPLSQSGFEVLEALSSGESLAAALAIAPIAPAVHVQGWFQQWTAAGLFVA
jgi:hypothetical protein